MTDLSEPGPRGRVVTPSSFSRSRLELASFGATAFVAAITALVLLPILAFAALGSFLDDPRPEQVAFDPQLWSGPDEWNSDIRARMTDDLRQNYLRPGTPQGDVKQILGQPPGTEASSQVWTYRLRDVSGFGPAAEYLLIRFDHDDRVESTEIFSRTD